MRSRYYLCLYSARIDSTLKTKSGTADLLQFTDVWVLCRFNCEVIIVKDVLP